MLKMLSRKALINSFFSFGTQGIQHSIPFIIYPFIIRDVGLESFGNIIFYFGVFNYLYYIGEYGLNLYGTKKISLYGNYNKEYLSRFLLGSLTLKFLILFIAGTILFFFAFYVQEFNSELGIAGYLNAAGLILTPQYIYIGTKNYKDYFIINFLFKLILLLYLILYVSSEYNYALGLAMINFLPACLCIAWLYVSGVTKITAISRLSIKNLFKRSFRIFYAQLSVSLFNNSAIVFLGIFQSKEIVGIYGAAEKIMKGAIAIINPINNLIYPKSVELFKESLHSGIKFVKRNFLLGTVFFALFSIVLFLLEDKISNYFLGYIEFNFLLVFRILLFIPLLVFWNNIFAIQLLLANGYNKAFSNILLIGSVLGVFSMWFFTYYFEYYYAAIIFLLIEMLFLFLEINFLKKKKIKLFNF